MDYLTTKQAAEELGVTQGRVQQLVAEKRISVTKIGRDNLITRAALDKFKETRSTRPGPRPKGIQNDKGNKTA